VLLVTLTSLSALLLLVTTVRSVGLAGVILTRNRARGRR
jgi:hypothetical protein